MLYNALYTVLYIATYTNSNSTTKKVTIAYDRCVVRDDACQRPSPPVCTVINTRERTDRSRRMKQTSGPPPQRPLDAGSWLRAGLGLGGRRAGSSGLSLPHGLSCGAGTGLGGQEGLRAGGLLQPGEVGGDGLVPGELLVEVPERNPAPISIRQQCRQRGAGSIQAHQGSASPTGITSSPHAVVQAPRSSPSPSPPPRAPQLLPTPPRGAFWGGPRPGSRCPSHRTARRLYTRRLPTRLHRTHDNPTVTNHKDSFAMGPAPGVHARGHRAAGQGEASGAGAGGSSLSAGVDGGPWARASPSANARVPGAGELLGVPIMQTPPPPFLPCLGGTRGRTPALSRGSPSAFPASPHQLLHTPMQSWGSRVLNSHLQSQSVSDDLNTPETRGGV